jgi:hypothetical protein
MLTVGKLYVKHAVQRTNIAFALGSKKTAENLHELAGLKTFGMQTEF